MIGTQKNSTFPSQPNQHNLSYVAYDCDTVPNSDTQISVKVHLNLLSNIVQKRQQNNKHVKKRKGYRVNKVIKPISFFYILKALTTSGVIKNYSGQLAGLTTQLNCATSTFYANLKKCKKMGLIAVDNGNLILAGYSSLGEYFGELSTQFVTIKYDFAKDKFYQLIETGYIAAMQQRRADQFNSRVARNPELVALLRRTLAVTTTSTSFAPELKKYQAHCFIHGHENYYELMALNPDTNCTAHTLRKAFNFKSYKSVAYLKNKLEAKGLIQVARDIHYTSKTRSRLKHAYITYNQQNKQTVWNLPDALTVAPDRLVF